MINWQTIPLRTHEIKLPTLVDIVKSKSLPIVLVRRASGGLANRKWPASRLLPRPRGPTTCRPCCFETSSSAALRLEPSNVSNRSVLRKILRTSSPPAVPSAARRDPSTWRSGTTATERRRSRERDEWDIVESRGVYSRALQGIGHPPLHIPHMEYLRDQSLAPYFSPPICSNMTFFMHFTPGSTFRLIKWCNENHHTAELSSVIIIFLICFLFIKL